MAAIKFSLCYFCYNVTSWFLTPITMVYTQITTNTYSIHGVKPSQHSQNPWYHCTAKVKGLVALPRGSSTAPGLKMSQHMFYVCRWWPQKPVFWGCKWGHYSLLLWLFHWLITGKGPQLHVDGVCPFYLFWHPIHSSSEKCSAPELRKLVDHPRQHPSSIDRSANKKRSKTRVGGIDTNWFI